MTAIESNHDGTEGFHKIAANFDRNLDAAEIDQRNGWREPGAPIEAGDMDAAEIAQTHRDYAKLVEIVDDICSGRGGAVHTRAAAFLAIISGQSVTSLAKRFRWSKQKLSRAVLEMESKHPYLFRKSAHGGRARIAEAVKIHWQTRKKKAPAGASAEVTENQPAKGGLLE